MEAQADHGLKDTMEHVVEMLSQAATERSEHSSLLNTLHTQACQQAEVTQGLSSSLSDQEDRIIAVERAICLLSDNIHAMLEAVSSHTQNMSPRPRGRPPSAVKSPGDGIKKPRGRPPGAKNRTKSISMDDVNGTGESTEGGNTGNNSDGKSDAEWSQEDRKPVIGSWNPDTPFAQSLNYTDYIQQQQAGNGGQQPHKDSQPTTEPEKNAGLNLSPSSPKALAQMNGDLREDLSNNNSVEPPQKKRKLSDVASSEGSAKKIEIKTPNTGEKKRRGRPPKIRDPSEIKPKRPRGRPPTKKADDGDKKNSGTPSRSLNGEADRNSGKEYDSSSSDESFVIETNVDGIVSEDEEKEKEEEIQQRSQAQHDVNSKASSVSDSDSGSDNEDSSDSNSGNTENGKVEKANSGQEEPGVISIDADGNHVTNNVTNHVDRRVSVSSDSEHSSSG